MGAPSYDEATLAAYFQPVGGALYDDPIVGPLLRHWAEVDRDLLDAVRDVDRSQIRDALAGSPAERLRVSSDLAESFARARRAR
jgi:hypothetical protein